MPTRNISLTDRYDKFVQKQIKSGRFQNASEVLRAGLSLLEQQEREREAKLKALRKAIAVAEEQVARGEVTDFDSDEELEAYFEGINQRLDAKRQKS